MAKIRKIPFVITFLALFFDCLFINAQDWEFIKEREGIRIFTRKEPNSSFKAFKGEAVIHAPLEEVSYLIGDAENYDWWDESISELTVLEFRKDEYIKYHLVYDVPWPVTDRDLCLEAFISSDQSTGLWTLNTRSIPDGVPEKEGLVRMVNYWQRWILEPLKDGTVHLILEGFADPAGSVPAWLSNLVITDTPYNVIRKVRERVE